MGKDNEKVSGVRGEELLKKRIAELEAIQAENERIKQIADEDKDLAKNIADTAQNPIIVLTADLKVVSVNKAFYNTFKVKPDATIDRFIYDLGNGQWNIPKLRKLLEDILPSSTAIENYEVEYDFQNIGKRIMILNARRIPSPPAKPRMMLLAIEDITELTRTAELIKANIDLKAFNKICVDRELKMVELKKEIDGLLRRLDEKTKYNSV